MTRISTCRAMLAAALIGAAAVGSAIFTAMSTTAAHAQAVPDRSNRSFHATRSH
jgi:hypothetical protein